MRSQSEVAAMSCPVCRVPLAMSERSGIEIDYCPQCRGVWLDRGELDKIIERSAPESQAALQPSQPLHQAGGNDPWAPRGYDHGGYGHGSHGQGDRGQGQHKPYKKRKHWLSDLFDD